IVDDAVNNLTVLDAVYFRMQAAEVAQPRHGAGAAKEALALHQQRRVSLAGGCPRCGNSSRAAAEHDDVVFATDRRLSGGLDNDAAHGKLHCTQWTSAMRPRLCPSAAPRRCSRSSIGG